MPVDIQSHGNPVRQWRERTYPDRPTAAKALEVSYAQLSQVENGLAMRLSPRFVQALERAGANGIRLADDYLTWKRRAGRRARRRKRTA